MSSKSYTVFTKFLMGILVILMIAGVAVWGINDILIGSGNKTVAKVGNSSISEYELDNAVQANKMQLMQSGINDISEEFKAVLRNNALVNIIADRLMQTEMGKLNIQLDEKEVLKHDYLSQPDFDKSKLKAIAHSMGGEDAFLKRITKEKKLDFMQGGLTATEPVTDEQINGVYNFENQTRNIEYVEMRSNIVKDTGDASEADLKAFYEKNKENFLTPEFRTASYVVIDKSSIKNPESDKDTVTQLHDISSQILDKVAGGETLEEISKEYGLDIKKIKSVNSEGKADDGTALNGFPKVNNFLPSIFATDQDQISDILESDDGSTYALVRVDQINEKRIRTYDEVKSLVAEGLKAQKRAEKLVEMAKGLKLDLDAGKTTLVDFAAKNDLEVKKKSDLKLKDKSFAPEFLTEIYNLSKNKFSNVNRTNNGALIIAKLTDINNAPASDKLSMFEYKSKIQEQVNQEIMAQYLDYLKSKYSVSVYSK